MSFKDRYPTEFSYFYGENTSLNEYDNSILYTDYLQADILNIVSKYGGKYLFIADHGLGHPNGAIPLKHDLRDNPDINSLKVPFFTSTDSKLKSKLNNPLSLFYFECIFSEWSGITAKELKDGMTAAPMAAPGAIRGSAAIQRSP